MRTYSKTLPMRQVQTTTNKATGAVTTSQGTAFAFKQQLVVIADTLHGDYKTVNPHEFRRNISQGIEGTIIRDDPSAIFVQTGYIQDVGIQTLTNPQVLRNDAIADLYDQLRSGDVGSGLDLAVDIAETRQVKRMLASSVRLVNFVRRFHPRQWANRWLEYQYGWKPLMNSVYGSVDALMHRRLYTLQRVTGKARARFDLYDSESKDTPVPGVITYTLNRVRERAMLVALFKLDNTLQQQLGGYTSLNPVSVAWELVPYSFVVDWVLDIGGYLRGLEGALAYGKKGFVSGYEVYGYKNEKWAELRNYTNKPIVGMTTYGLGAGFNHYSYKRRIPMGAYPIPTLPSFRANLGWQRLVSAASLLSQHVEGYDVWKRRGELLPEVSQRKPWVEADLRRGLRDVLTDVRLGNSYRIGRFPG